MIEAIFIAIILLIWIILLLPVFTVTVITAFTMCYDEIKEIEGKLKHDTRRENKSNETVSKQ